MNYIQSILNVGAGGIVVRIECQLSNGLPSIVIVGLGNKAVDEAKERVRSAFATTNLVLPKTHNYQPGTSRRAQRQYEF